MRFSHFSFRAPAPTEIYTLSLHDALPICSIVVRHNDQFVRDAGQYLRTHSATKYFLSPRVTREMAMVEPTLNNLTADPDRKSTRLNSSHVSISYAVFCLKKKNYNAQFQYI